MHGCTTFIFLLITWSPVSLFAQLDSQPLIEDVGVEEHLGETINLDLEFTNRFGEKVTLGQLIQVNRPTILAPVYYSCPGLCTLVLNGVARLVNDLEFQMGTDYQVINISFDPTNTPDLAKEKAGNYYRTLNDAKAAESHWHFLTGQQENIAQFTQAIGFNYKKANDQYSHASVLVLVSPQGKITRYLYGVDYPGKDVRRALVEASQGKVGNTLDKMLMYCFRYDPLAGKYVPYAWGIMRIGAGLTLLIMLVGGFFLWKSDLLKKRRLRQHV